jgi:hypothetical protein
MKWLLSRLSEPSTHAGLGILLQLAKTLPAAAPYAQVIDGVCVALGTAAVATSERAQ